MKSKPNHNANNHYKWGLIGVTVMLWCFVIGGIILKYSSSSDFNYSNGKLANIKRFEYDVKNRLGRKIGTAHKLKFRLTGSNTIFYIDNNFSSDHHYYIERLKSSRTVEVWSDGDLLDGSEQRVYKLKGEGSIIIPFDSTKKVYVDKSHLAFYLAIFATIFSLIVIRPKRFLKLVQSRNNADDSLIEFYLDKFESRNTEDLENIVQNKSNFHPDAVIAAQQTLGNR